jgi:alcohol dehydrogenase class IV
VIDPFTWQDGERTVRFGRGTLATAGELLGDGYALLTTPRARAAAPDVVAAASSVHDVAPGLVDELSAALLEEVPDAPLIVALGGGRVIDTAKAVAAGRGGVPRVAAIPTTLSAAEMTRVHRLPAGREAQSTPVRPAIVINDPALAASQPLDELAASAANSLAHAAEGAVTDLASVVPRLAAAEAVRLTAAAYDGVADDGEPDRDALALAAVLSGYTIDSTRYGLHHVLSQTLVRVGGLGHGPANAAMLPHTAAALAERAGERALAGVVPLARELARRAGATSLAALGADRATLERCADAAAERPDLARTPPAADRAELLALYEAAL